MWHMPEHESYLNIASGQSHLSHLQRVSALQRSLSRRAQAATLNTLNTPYPSRRLAVGRRKPYRNRLPKPLACIALSIHPRIPALQSDANLLEHAALEGTLAHFSPLSGQGRQSIH